MKQLLLLFSPVFINGCAVFSSHPFSDYNDNYLNATVIEKCKIYSVDMGDESLLVYPTISSETGFYGNPKIKLNSPKIFRLVDGQLVQVNCKECNKK